MGIRSVSKLTVAAAATIAVLTAACQPLPPVEPGSTVIDCSRASERIELTASSHLEQSCTYSGGFDITTSGVTLDCRGATVKGAPGNGNRGIAITAPAEVALHDVTIRNCRVEGFLNNIRIHRTGFKTFAEGEEFEHPTSNIVLENNRFLDAHGVGVYIDAYVSDVTVRDNQIHRAGSTGIYLETGSRRNMITGNSLVDNGFRENGPSGQAFRSSGIDLWFWGVGREGIAIDGSYENTVSDNAFLGNSAGGIFLYKNCGEYPQSPRYFERRDPADRNLIEANVFLGGRNGVWVGSRMAENTYPMDCTDPAYVSEPLRRVVLDYAADNVVRGNDFYDVTYGVRVEDDRTTVEANTFTGPDPGHHAVIIGTPERTAVLARPVTDTILRANVSSIVANPFPYREIHDPVGTVVADNEALGAPTGVCAGAPLPRQQFIFAIAVAVAGPGGTPPATTPDLTVPTLGALEDCPT